MSSSTKNILTGSSKPRIIFIVLGTVLLTAYILTNYIDFAVTNGGINPGEMKGISDSNNNMLPKLRPTKSSARLLTEPCVEVKDVDELLDILAQDLIRQFAQCRMYIYRFYLDQYVSIQNFRP